MILEAQLPLENILNGGYFLFLLGVRVTPQLLVAAHDIDGIRPALGQGYLS
jgi:hypothetical protein